MMDRRTFIAALIGVLGAVSSATRAERMTRPYRIGFLANNPGPQPAHEGLREGLRDLGWIEGRDFLIEARYANFDTSKLRTFAAELVALPVDVLVVVTIAPASAAKEATKDIPIVVVAAHDAVGAGLVASLSRPCGNLTGLDSLAPGLDAKRLELLKQILPGVTHLAVLANPLDSAMRLHLDGIQSAAAALGLTIRVYEVRQPTELENAFAAMARERPDALMPITEALIYSSRGESLRLVNNSACLGCSSSASSRAPEGCSRMGQTCVRCTCVPPITWTRFSRVPSPAIFPSSSPPCSSW